MTHPAARRSPATGSLAGRGAFGLPLEVVRTARSRTGRASCACSSVAQRQSIRLLTGGLLVRIQPEEPISFHEVGTLGPGANPFSALGLFDALSRSPAPPGNKQDRIQTTEFPDKEGMA